MEWDPELLATLRKLREDASRRRKERTASRTPNPTITPEIKMVVSEWYTDELGNRARMIYNAKTADFETPYDLSRGFSLA
jgi:hypothetical protein